MFLKSICSKFHRSPSKIICMCAETLCCEEILSVKKKKQQLGLYSFSFREIELEECSRYGAINCEKRRALREQQI